MTDFEKQILGEIVNKSKPTKWGAAVGVALEYLISSGYITKTGLPTAKGRNAVSGMDHATRARART